MLGYKGTTPWSRHENDNVVKQNYEMQKSTNYSECL